MLGLVTVASFFSRTTIIDETSFEYALKFRRLGPTSFFMSAAIDPAHRAVLIESLRVAHQDWIFERLGQEFGKHPPPVDGALHAASCVVGSCSTSR
jgi:hypothetical protein